MICRYRARRGLLRVLSCAKFCEQIAWHMFHSKKRAIIMPDIVKQISLISDGAPCESKNIYPTAVLLDLCSTAFHCDPSLVDAHLRAVVAAFCARSKVQSPIISSTPGSSAHMFFLLFACLIPAFAPDDLCRFPINPRKSSSKKFGLHSRRQATLGAKAPLSLCTAPLSRCPSHTLMSSQTCFCCVLQAQHVEPSADLQHCPHDQLAAEMLKVLTRPFMV